MNDIRKYEAMAMFELPDDERGLLQQRFDALTGAFGALDAIPADNVEPLVTVLELSNILREDVSVKLLSREELLSAAPEQYDGYFQVPGTLE